MADQVPATGKLNLWMIAAVVLLVALIVGGSIFGPALKSSKKLIVDLQTSIIEKDSTITKLTHEKETLSLKITKSRVSGSLRIPIQMPNGTVEYREAKWIASSESEIRNQVREELSTFQESVTITQSVTILKGTSSETVTKRYPCAIGAGISEEKKPGGSLEGFIGPFGIEVVGCFNTKRGEKFVEHSYLFGKLRF